MLRLNSSLLSLGILDGFCVRCVVGLTAPANEAHRWLTSFDLLSFLTLSVVIVVFLSTTSFGFVSSFLWCLFFGFVKQFVRNLFKRGHTIENLVSRFNGRVDVINVTEGWTDAP